MLLTQHYSPSPICSPARAGILTGRYPHRTGAIETRELRGLCNLALRETTVADLLKARGYATGLVGKWHTGCYHPKWHPNARGFDEFAGFRSGWQDYWNWVLDRNGAFEKSDGRYLTDVFTDEAVGFIDRHKHRPFFLFLCYNAPHTPLHAPAEDVKPFADTGKFTTGVSTIYGMVRRMDRGIERLLEALDRRGLRDNTLVVFTSDNGPQFGGRGDSCIERFNCDLSGSKSKVYEGGIRVPAILRWPDGLPGENVRFGGMAHGTDWMPTLLAAAGAEPPAELRLDGTNILPALRSESSDLPPRRFWQWNRWEPRIETNAAMRDGDWKLVRPSIRGLSDTDPEEQKLDDAYRSEPWGRHELIVGPYPPREIPVPPPAELYNIAEDPLERNNLADRHPERVERMMRALLDWFEDVEADRASIGGHWAGA
ncbi:MAG: Arylsulfatase precursor [candidate division BRC1 bacterium ADurb.BinA364]|nr:MAG: Arylsulfatase precursor [candidate division BRC1 bacterium ADurb.BinA364]